MVIIDYTECTNGANEICSDVIKKYVDGIPQKCTCDLEIPKDEIGDVDWEGQVFLYYGLTNFYQNHRRYVKSRDDKQLYGDLDSRAEDCSPFLFSDRNDNTSPRYAPCGAIANSMFNDTISLQYMKDGETDWANVSPAFTFTRMM